MVNTGDDVVIHGLHVSPDLDTVTYTLAGAINHGDGMGPGRRDLGGDGAPLEPLPASRLTWFRLGDRDLATHLYRTQRLRRGRRAVRR